MAQLVFIHLALASPAKTGQRVHPWTNPPLFDLAPVRPTAKVGSPTQSPHTQDNWTLEIHGKYVQQAGPETYKHSRLEHDQYGIFR